MNPLVLGLIVAALVMFSALCSGLNVALMALDGNDLKRKARLGNRAAATVLPLRTNSNLSLAAILLASVAAVSATSLVLNSQFTGWIAGAVTTLLIVIFGEIFPQAYLVRHALRATAKLSPLLKLMIFCTWPLSKPLQLLLDKVFGKHVSRSLQSRHELGLMIAEHADNAKSELDYDEVEIIRGALQLSEKRVRDIMTPIRHVYWLEKNETIDGPKIDEIKKAN
ncbi:MAG: CNNM domain-containing protein, partial [Candidatus Saccharimonadales bacterium]